jgi:hypothetical protein
VNAVAPYAKAVVAAVLAALSVLSGYLLNADTGFGDISAGQWVAVAVAFFVALGAVFAVPNKPRA